MATLGENIRLMRKRLKITQLELARSAGISQSTLSAIESNLQNPSISTIQLLSGALHCSSNSLLGEECAPYDAGDLPPELLRMLYQLKPSELQRVQDFAAGIIAAREL